MHIATGTSALNIIRCIRAQGRSVALEWFSEVEQPIPDAYLPDAKPPSAPQGREHADLLCPLFEETLEQASFPFDRVVANRRIDLSRIDGSEMLAHKAPLELGIFDLRLKTYRDSLRTRLLRRDLPRQALVGAGKHTCFSCPELVVLQLAQQLSVPLLAQVIMELAGFYALAPSQDFETVYDIPPITTLARIETLARRARMMRGRSVLRAALHIACERSASPAETILAIMLQSPIQDGGYGIERPLLNPCITAPRGTRSHVSQQHFYPDIYLQGCYTDIEYESTEFHLDPITTNWQAGELKNWQAGFAQKAANERRRARELQSLGVHVIPVTSYDMVSRAKLDNVAWSLARQMERLGQIDAASYMRTLDTSDYRNARTALLENLKK